MTDNECRAALLPCPFCGDKGQPFLQHIGNEQTKERGIDIGCLECGIRKCIRVIRYSCDWAEQRAIEYWNIRALLPSPEVTPPQLPEKTCNGSKVSVIEKTAVKFLIDTEIPRAIALVEKLYPLPDNEENEEAECLYGTLRDSSEMLRLIIESIPDNSKPSAEPAESVVERVTEALRDAMVNTPSHKEYTRESTADWLVILAKAAIAAYEEAKQ